MITIVEPQERIDRLWGKQKIREGETYRLMRYVLRVDHEDKVLLHNVVTGRLVVLDREEAEALETLPSPYSPVMEQLVTEHYLVPENYDEHQQVINLRTILRKLDDAQKDGCIVSYCILPTTGCNARCYYCYEHGIESVTMSEQTADGVVKFIKNHCGDRRKITIQWFGGEPTIASARIDQICSGLRNEGVGFVSTMITNGYLFDQNMVERAKKNWNLVSLQISIDGTEEQCNRIKAFAVKAENPYRRIIRNVGLLIQNEIHVGLRMNFDLDNAGDFEPLVKEIMGLYGKSEFLQVYAYPVVGEYARPDGRILHGSDAWFDKTLLELNSLARRMGVRRHKPDLPFLKYRGCGAQRDSFIAIMPDGGLVKCIEQPRPEQIVGNLQAGVVNHALVESWKRFADYDKCKACPYYPECLKPKDCSGKDRCYKSDSHSEFTQTIRDAYHRKTERNEENGFRGTESGICSD